MKKLAIINSDPMDCNYGGVAPFLRNMHPYLSETFDVEYFTIPSTWTGKHIPGRIKMMYTLFKRRKEIKACDFALSHVPEGSYVISFMGIPYSHIFHGNFNPMNGSRYRVGKYFKWLFDIFEKRIEKTCTIKYTVGPVNGDKKKLMNPVKHNVSEKPYSQRKGFIFAGRLELIKNIDRIIRIYSKLPESLRKDNPLYIAGFGTQEEALKKLVVDMGLTEYVKFLGSVPNTEIPEVDSTKKILLMASSHEGLPTAIAEALSVGVPVVSTDIGDIRLVIKDNVNGFLLPLDFKDEEYIDAMQTILNDYDRFAKAAKEAFSVFDAEKITKQVIKDINNVLNEQDKNKGSKKA